MDLTTELKLLIFSVDAKALNFSTITQRILSANPPKCPIVVLLRLDSAPSYSTNTSKLQAPLPSGKPAAILCCVIHCPHVKLNQTLQIPASLSVNEWEV